MALYKFYFDLIWFDYQCISATTSSGPSISEFLSCCFSVESWFFFSDSFQNICVWNLFLPTDFQHPSITPLFKSMYSFHKTKWWSNIQRFLGDHLEKPIIMHILVFINAGFSADVFSALVVWKAARPVTCKRNLCPLILQSFDTVGREGGRASYS